MVKTCNDLSRSSRCIDKLVSKFLAIEAETAKEAGMLAYMARSMVMATMPHSKPSSHVFQRDNGDFSLTMIGNPKFGLPYGSLPRLLLAWITREAKVKKSPVLQLGKHFSAFLSLLNLSQNGGRIRLARNMVGLTRKEIYEKCEISVHTLQSWESGKVSLSPHGAKRLNQAFTQLSLLCSETWLLTGQGQPPMLLNNDFRPDIEQDLLDDFCILKEIEAFRAINPMPTVSIIADDGMVPLYELGDYVAGNKKENADILNIVGKNCIVETTSGETLIRKLLKGSKENLFTLSCINAHTNQQPVIYDVRLLYAANIIWHRSKEN